MIRIAIVEDEEKCRELLENHAKRFAREEPAELEITAFSDGLQLVERYTPRFDVIFLDIQMPQMDGMEAARRIREHDEDVILIFVTNLAQMALKAFEVSATDFVIKPVSYPAFQQKMKKVVRMLAKRPQSFVMLPFKGGMQKMPAEEIYYIEVRDHRLYCHTAEGEKLMASGTLSALEAKLAEAHFSRCNSCYLVNLRYVSSIARDSITVGEDTLAVSRSRKKAFLQELAEYVGG